MNNNTFAAGLKDLMKERKVSGQKIADIVGVSQKTVSRYANGDVTPSRDMQKKILEAIAKEGGHPEDADMDKRPRMPFPSVRVALKSKAEILSEDDVLDAERQKTALDMQTACKVFSSLSERNQLFVLENFDVYSRIDAYEVAIVEAFSVIPEERRNFIVNKLKLVNLSFSAMKSKPDACLKIADYMKMMGRCKGIKTERFENVSPTPCCREFADRLKKARGEVVERLGAYLHEMITFDETDWYLLVLIQMYGLEDIGANTTYYGKIVGDNLYQLITYTEKLSEKYAPTEEKE